MGVLVMKKEVFISEYDRISAQISELENKLNELRNEYINSNAPFPVGTKVRVSYAATQNTEAYEEYGIVQGWTLDPDDDVIPFLAKIKKDGTVHPTAKVYVYSRKKPTFEAC